MVVRGTGHVHALASGNLWMSSHGIDDRFRLYLINPSPQNELGLLATGEPGLQRLLDIWLGEIDSPFDRSKLPATKDPREDSELFLSAIHSLATAHPQAYMDRI